MLTKLRRTDREMKGRTRLESRYLHITRQAQQRYSKRLRGRDAQADELKRILVRAGNTIQVK